MPSGLRSLLKLLLSIIIIGLLAQTARLYFAIVIAGNYIYIAPILNIILVAVAWPLAALIGAWFAIDIGFKLINGDYNR